MALTMTDEDLVGMTTAELRSLWEQQLLSNEEHKELRGRRRRLQNRKYARRCARKKQTEVAQLTLDVEEETEEIQALRQQLSRINMSIDRIERQVHVLAKFQQAIDENNLCMHNNKNTVRMLLPDGTQTGVAFLAPTKPKSGACAASQSNLGPNACSLSNSATLSSAAMSAISALYPNVDVGLGVHNQSRLGHPHGISQPPHNTGLARMATGSSITHPAIWPSSPAFISIPNGPRLVRPVGGGLTSRGRSLGED